MKICVQGMWHLGAVTAACLASAGHTVIGLDFDLATVAALNSGTPPIHEPGLTDLIRQGLADGSLRFSADAEDALAEAHLLWVTYDTPVNALDDADVDFVLAQVERAMPCLADGSTVLVSSQLPAGSVHRLEMLARAAVPSRTFGFACSPENLRLGKALEVFLHPDRIVVGARTDRDRRRIAEMLASITCNIEWMSVEAAEMTKHAINAFLAMSVVFANELATLCESLGVDAKDVEKGLRSESRIGPKAYLSPGAAFAGGTFARDVNFLKSLSTASGLDSVLIRAINDSNNQHRHWPRHQLMQHLGALDGCTVAVWGLTYKAGTDTLRRSLSVELCEYLLANGASLVVHDPVATLPATWQGKVKQVAAPEDALVGARALVVATEWPEYSAVTPAALMGLSDGFLVIDPNRFLAHWKDVPTIRYVAVGSPVRHGELAP